MSDHFSLWREGRTRGVAVVSHDKVEVVGKGSIGRQDNAHYGGERTKKNEENSEPLRDFIFRARRLFFFYTIRNNYSRRRRQTHPFLKVFIIKSS